MKILEICPFSAGICGVWARVREEAIRLANKGYEIRIFSSNFIKGSKERAVEKDKLGKIEIHRFPARKLGGESFMEWDFKQAAIDFKPDIIIAHAYRHSHTLKALKIAERLRIKGRKCRVFLVTHAPFNRDSTRSFLARIAVWYYDKFIAPKTINKFDKVIAITKWEIPYLLKLGLKKEKIELIPNGAPEEFFTIKKLSKEENKILFLGRVAEIKNLETVILSIPLLKDKKIKFEIVGPSEKDYLWKLKKLIKKLKIENRVTFSPPIYDTKEKIKKIDSAMIFVLPSKSEGMPQSLIEAMARRKIVISSNNSAGKEIIRDGKNGFLFRIGDEKELAKKINLALNKKNEKLKNEARKSVVEFRWEKIIGKLNDLIKK
ncbi:MAG: glycosyltransferase family 4 protein [Candidatus Pacearchaeota archaeon]